jgi:hypothetical protein
MLAIARHKREGKGGSVVEERKGRGEKERGGEAGKRRAGRREGGREGGRERGKDGEKTLTPSFFDRSPPLSVKVTG